MSCAAKSIDGKGCGKLIRNAQCEKAEEPLDFCILEINHGYQTPYLELSLVVIRICSGNRSYASNISEAEFTM
jgi:hypothetical protein